MDEVVTRRILADELIESENRLETNLMRKIGLKFEEEFEKRFAEQELKIDERFGQLENKLDTKFDVLAKRLDEKLEQQNRNLGALIEEQNDRIKMLAESIMMQTEASDRKWQEHLELHRLAERRLARLESEVLIG